MKIQLANSFSIQPFRIGDEKPLAENLNKPEVRENLLQLPQPYTLDIASTWVRDNINYGQRHCHYLNLVIRNQTDDLIGGIGKKLYQEPDYQHACEIGYWLNPDFWNKGITSAAVKSYTQYLLKQEDYTRICAYSEEENRASARVLEKSGFKLEGILNKFVKKDKQFKNCFLFAVTK